MCFDRVCEIVTESRASADTLLESTLKHYCPVHGPRGQKLHENFESVVCDVIRFSPDPALRKLLAGVLLKAGMQGAEIIRMVEKRSSSEECIEGEGEGGWHSASYYRLSQNAGGTGTV